MQFPDGYQHRSAASSLNSRFKHMPSEGKRKACIMSSADCCSGRLTGGIPAPNVPQQALKLIKDRKDCHWHRKDSVHCVREQHAFLSSIASCMYPFQWMCGHHVLSCRPEALCIV